MLLSLCRLSVPYMEYGLVRYRVCKAVGGVRVSVCVAVRVDVHALKL